MAIVGLVAVALALGILLPRVVRLGSRRSAQGGAALVPIPVHRSGARRPGPNPIPSPRRLD